MVEIDEIKKGTEIGYKDFGKYSWQSCTQCGKERWVRLRHGKPEFRLCSSCGSGRYEQHIPIGHRRKENDYWLVYIGRDDFFSPMAHTDRAFVLEHRLVMAKHLRRCLHAWEVVHHRNGNKEDNRIENLSLVMEAGHNQISQMQLTLVRQERTIQELQKRVTLLEAELALKIIKEGRNGSAL